MNQVHITMLGSFSFKIRDLDLSDKLKSSPKKILLLQYLILYENTAVSTDKLIEILWNGDKDPKVRNALKTMVSRLRKDLEDLGISGGITTGHNSYMWKSNFPCRNDIVEFEKYYESLMKSSSLNKQNRKQFETAIDSYKGELLSGSGLEKFIPTKSLYMQNMYIKLIRHYISLLSKSQEYDEIIRVCAVATKIYPLESSLALEMMAASNKSTSSAASPDEDMDVSSGEIIEFYKDIIKKDYKLEQNIEGIFTELSDYSNTRGAYVCEYPIFKEIYSLHIRNLKRHGAVMYLAIVGIVPPKNDVEPEKIDTAMNDLLNLLTTKLRSGDTISRYSSTQYVALLPAMTQVDVGHMIMERMERAYYDAATLKDHTFTYRLVRMIDASVEETIHI